MGSSPREILFAAALALWFPVALAVTDAASSEPGEIGTPTRVPSTAPTLTGAE